MVSRVSSSHSIMSMNSPRIAPKRPMRTRFLRERFPGIYIVAKLPDDCGRSRCRITGTHRNPPEHAENHWHGFLTFSTHGRGTPPRRSVLRTPNGAKRLFRNKGEHRYAL